MLHTPELSTAKLYPAALWVAKAQEKLEQVLAQIFDSA